MNGRLLICTFLYRVEFGCHLKREPTKKSRSTSFEKPSQIRSFVGKKYHRSSQSGEDLEPNVQGDDLYWTQLQSTLNAEI
jgi:hypothetical protein